MCVSMFSIMIVISDHIIVIEIIRTFAAKEERRVWSHQCNRLTGATYTCGITVALNTFPLEVLHIEIEGIVEPNVEVRVPAATDEDMRVVDGDGGMTRTSTGRCANYNRFLPCPSCWRW